MNFSLYNTITKAKERFVPLNRDNIRMYVCGPTVYDEPHIGNARPAIVFDLLYRLLRNIYGKSNVTYVRNITDLDDKINNAALSTYPDVDINKAIHRVTSKVEKVFKDNMRELNCLEPNEEPKATDHIQDMIKIIDKLIKSGNAYLSEGHVIFNIHSFEPYGQLSNKSKNDLIAGARVDVAKYKKDPLDFVLWKPSLSNEPGWESPWGNGRPGWHIECSAMSSKYLGEVFDIHGGGIDLVFPHHENEIAQSCSYHSNSKMANFFMHNGSLNIEGKKMSKSLGNIVKINDLLNKWSGNTIRLSMLKTNYRQPIDWTNKNLSESESIINKWMDKVIKISSEEIIESNEVVDALLDDLNTPMAITIMHGYYNNQEFGKLYNAMDMIGLKIEQQKTSFDKKNKKVDKVLVDKLIQQRNEARKNKDYLKSDDIRNKLEKMGIKLQDKNNETTWEYLE